MEALIAETRQIAEERFKSFGFAPEQIEQLLSSGERDIRKEWMNLRSILSAETCDEEALNKSLHALKGLVLNMGNEALAEQLTELRTEENNQMKVETLKKLAGVV